MSHFSQILSHWSERRSLPFALATIMHTQGSTYRKAGARMLIDSRGHTVGMLSGGCLEEEIALRARRVLRKDAAERVVFDTRRLFGCNGSLEILLEPVRTGEADNLMPAAAESFQRRCALIGTTMCEAEGRTSGYSGSYALFAEDGTQRNARPFLKSCSNDAVEGLERVDTVERTYLHEGAVVRALLQRVAPPLRLVICGGGPDIVPMVNLALQLGWEPHILAAQSTSALDLPPACRVWRAAPEDFFAHHTADQRTFAVIMSHNYGRDLALLKAALSQAFRYVGLLGPASRRKKILNELADLGFLPEEDALQNLHSPAGLDIGADGPEEIALSIVGEIQAVSRNRPGIPLRNRCGPIHP
jgi:xanthine/CO dehydrogenase XdhC/CoxF family maturation factor